MRTEKEVAGEISLVAGTEDRQKLKDLLLELNLIVLGFSYTKAWGYRNGEYSEYKLIMVEPNGDCTTLN